MAAKFASIPPGTDLSRPRLERYFWPSYIFFKMSDERSDPAKFQKSAGLSSPREAKKATLLRFDKSNQLQRVCEGVAYYFGEGDEEAFKHLEEDHQQHALVPVRLEVEGEEDVVRGRFFKWYS
jgi:hypothetical protein